MDDQKSKIEHIQSVFGCDETVATKMLDAGYRDLNMDELMGKGKDEVNQIKRDFTKAATEVSEEINTTIEEHNKFFDKRKDNI